MKLHLKIKAARIAQDLSQGEVAAATGLDQPAISKFESGERKLPKESIEAICEHLGLALDPESSKQTIFACGNIYCPLSLISVEKGKLKAKPVTFVDEPGKVLHCSACGSLLIAACERNGCGAPLKENSSFCHACGEPYVQIPPELKNLTNPTNFQDRHNHIRDKYIETIPIKK